MKTIFLRIFNDKFFKDSFFYMAGSVFVGLFGYAFHFYVSRKLSVGEYGELQSLLSFFTVLTISSSAISYFIIKHISVFAKKNDKASSSTFIEAIRKKLSVLNIVLAFLLILSMPLIVKILKLSDYYGLMAMIAAAFFSIFATVYRAALSGWSEFRKVTVIGIASAFAKLFSGAMLVTFFASAGLVSVSVLLSSILSWILGVFLSGKFIQDGENKIVSEEFSFAEMKKDILPVLIFSSVLILISNVDVLLVKSLTTSEMTGYFGVLSILGKVILWLNLSVVAVVLPTACAGKIGSKLLAKAYGLIGLISFSAIGAYLLFPTFIIKLLFGSKYVVFSSDLWLFGIMALLLSVLTLEANLAYARSDYRISYVLGVVVVLMSASIFFLHSSIREIALGLLASFFIGYLSALAIKSKKGKTKPVCLENFDLPLN